MTTFTDIIQAPLKELYLLKASGSIKDLELKLYVEVLHAYLLSDASELDVLSKNTKGDLRDITELRKQIVTKTVSSAFLEELEVGLENRGRWKGEYAFVMGIAYWALQQNQEALKAFQKSYTALWEIGAKKKAVKALMNVVVSEDRIDNKKKCISSYEFVKEKALEVGDRVVAGLCYHNMAKEYLKLGGAELSLKYSHLAVDHLGDDKGVNHYYEAILHRCHTLIELGRYHEALIDFQTAKASPTASIQEALRAIEVLLGDKKELRLDHLEPSWRTKLQTSANVVKTEELTKLESRFIEMISHRPQSKSEILKALYGNIEEASAENRFNVFLTRFKKKFPGVLSQENGNYGIVDNSLIEVLIPKS